MQLFDFAISEIALRLGIGFSVSFLIGLTGVGGGVLLIPSLKLLLNMPTALAVGTASLYITMTKIMGTYQHARIKNIDYWSSSYFLAGAIPGVLLVAFPVNYFLRMYENTPVAVTIDRALTAVLAVVIFMSIVMLLADFFVRNRSRKTQDQQKSNIFPAVCSGFFCGLILGGTGIGGGILIVPTLISLLKLNAKKTVGSSMLIALILSGISALVYAEGGNADVMTAVLLAVGGIPGIFMAVRLITIIPVETLKIVVIGLVAVSAVLMLLDSYAAIFP